MERKIKKKEQGITLIALIISIIILIILAMVAINAIYEFRIVDIAVNGAGDYVKTAKEENEILEQTTYFLDVATNSKPVIEKLNVSEKSTSSLKIVCKATDKDKEELTYTLHFGKSENDLQPLEDVKKVAEGTEIIWEQTGLDDNTTYYYKVEVKDKYGCVESSIKSIITDRRNKSPEINGIVQIMKGINEITAKVNAIDEDGDKLTYTLYVWDLEGKTIEEVTGKTESNVNIESLANMLKDKIIVEEEQGKEVTLTTNVKLDESKYYYYRVDVDDNWGGKVEQTIMKTNTLCSGTNIACNVRDVCSNCRTKGSLFARRLYYNLFRIV